ncbi:MAG: hypothetical protein KDA45_17340 [Planctomycetales bacterium]|nr:hypothetical protein [Planctomycetales bacterium]
MALLWGAASVSLASRLHMVLNYATFAQGPASLEPFLSSNAAWCFVLLMAAIWLRLFQANLAPHPQRAKLAAGCWALACLPWLFALGGLGSPGYWEVLWLSAWSGWSFALLSDGLSAHPRLRRP